MGVAVNTVSTRMLPDLHSDSYANLVWFTQAELTTFLDQALKRLARFAGLFVLRNTATTVSTSTRTYATPSRHLSTIRLTLNGVPLVPASTDELSMRNPSYETTTGTPRRWYQDTLGTALTGLEPVPNAGVNGQTLARIYHEFPTELSHGSNTTIPVPGCIADYLEAVALGECYGKESDAQCPEISAHLKEHAGLWEEVIKEYWEAVQ